ncbi:MAG TPA: prolipoprotein diacylglyceryl transferase family protein [Acidimicrobiales bacterium]|nr:prolipoprotein diacylglyceryl transferase family protein [Acidimicrobiales bacterium]
MLAAIPYTTFPEIDLGFVQIRTFGLMVALGVFLGAWIAARMGERWGIPADDTISLATRLVIVGVIGSRLTWVATHWDQIDSPVDVIAVWEGGLQFSGGFIAAVLIGMPTFRKWSRLTRWRMLDGMALGLTVGLAFGRVGCYSVGEHLGSSTSFFLGTRFDGGSTREPIQVGDVIHHTALYEGLHLLVLALLLFLLLRAKPVAGSLIGWFCVWYGVARFGTDLLRVNDDTVLGLTGAQWMCVALVPAGLWILFKVRRTLARSDVDDVVDVEDESATPEPSSYGGTASPS